MIRGQQNASSQPLPAPKMAAPPPPTPLGGRTLAASHDHAACPGCVCQMEAINRLQDDLRRARGRADEAEHRIRVLEERIERMGATPEMGRRKWDFEGGK